MIQQKKKVGDEEISRALTMRSRQITMHEKYHLTCDAAATAAPMYMYRLKIHTTWNRHVRLCMWLSVWESASREIAMNVNRNGIMWMSERNRNKFTFDFKIAKKKSNGADIIPISTHTYTHTHIICANVDSCIVWAAQLDVEIVCGDPSGFAYIRFFFVCLFWIRQLHMRLYKSVGTNYHHRHRLRYGPEPAGVRACTHVCVICA